MSGSSESPRVFGLVITFQRPQLLAAMLDALDQQTYAFHEVLVVDNDPRESASDLCRSARYVATGDNLGPAGAFAVGIEVLSRVGSDDDWVLLLDDDDPPTEREALGRLVALARTAPGDVGAVCPVGGLYDRQRGRPQRVPDTMLRGVVDLDWSAGGVLPMYRLGALRAAGPDPSLFFGFDDLDVGLRLRDAGFRIIADGDRWREGRSIGGRSGLTDSDIRAQSSAMAPWRTYYSVRNQVLIARRHASALGIASCLGLSVARCARALLRGRRHGVMAAKGLVDGVLGRSGRRVNPDG